MTGRAILVSLIMVLATATITAHAAELPEIEPGTAYALDGETLMRGEQEVRLFGIDAPEIEDVPLGPQARRALDHLLAGRRIDCATKNKDRYGRVMAVCTVGAQDIGRLMVRQGWAITDRRFTRDYDLEERAAAAAGRGLWGAPGGHGTGFWATVDRYQTLIAGVIGLWGIAVAWWLNGHETRARDERIRRQDAAQLAGSLISDLGEIATTCLGISRSIAEQPTEQERAKTFLRFAGIASTELMSAQRGRFALFAPDIAIELARIFGLWSAFNRVAHLVAAGEGEDLADFKDPQTVKNRIYDLGQRALRAGRTMATYQKGDRAMIKEVTGPLPNLENVAFHF